MKQKLKIIQLTALTLGFACFGGLAYNLYPLATLGVGGVFFFVVASVVGEMASECESHKQEEGEEG